MRILVGKGSGESFMFPSWTRCQGTAKESLPREAQMEPRAAARQAEQCHQWTEMQLADPKMLVMSIWFQVKKLKSEREVPTPKHIYVMAEEKCSSWGLRERFVPWGAPDEASYCSFSRFHSADLLWSYTTAVLEQTLSCWAYGARTDEDAEAYTEGELQVL